MGDYEEIDYEPQDDEQALHEVEIEIEQMYQIEREGDPMIVSDRVRGRIYQLQRWRDELQRRVDNLHERDNRHY